MKKKSEVHEIFIDGASRGNPGHSGIGIIINRGENIIRNISKYIGETTNNIAEYSAFIYALEEALLLHLDKVRINTDSELLYRQIKGIYRVRSCGIRPYYERAMRLMRGFNLLEINHIRREYNKGADKLAAAGADRKIAVVSENTKARKNEANKERWLPPPF